LSLLPLLGSAQQAPAFSAYILNIDQGKPAPGVTMSLEKYDDAKKTWGPVAEKQTDAASRIGDFLPTAGQKNPTTGAYKLIFRLGPTSRPGSKPLSTSSSKWCLSWRGVRTTMYSLRCRPSADLRIRV